MTNDKIEEMVIGLHYAPYANGKHIDLGCCGGDYCTVYHNKELENYLRTTLTTFANEIRKERVTHCDDINCPECPKAAYEAGVKAERERVREWARKQYFATTADGKRVILNNTLVDFLSDNK